MIKKFLTFFLLTGLFLITRPQAGFCVDTVTQSQETQDVLQNFRTVADEAIYAGSFNATANRTPIKISMYMSKTGSPTGNVWLEIWSDSGGNPGSIITNGQSANVDVSTLSGDWKDFTFSTFPSLTNGSQYWLVMKGDYTYSGTHYANVGKNTADGSETVIRDNDLVSPFGYSASQTIAYKLWEDVAARRIILIE